MSKDVKRIRITAAGLLVLLIAAFLVFGFSPSLIKTGIIFSSENDFSATPYREELSIGNLQLFDFVIVVLLFFVYFHRSRVLSVLLNVTLFIYLVSATVYSTGLYNEVTSTIGSLESYRITPWGVLGVVLLGISFIISILLTVFVFAEKRSLKENALHGTGVQGRIENGRFIKY